jgi:methyltransferase
MIATALILLVMTAQRLIELTIAGRNTRKLLARGAVESGRGHYPLIVALHVAWLGGLWLLAWGRPASLFWLAVYLVIQALRVWVIGSLGERWTTRIITLPGEPLVRRGPYRFISHPNYVVVAAEIAAAPLIFSLPVYALVFFVLNAAVLWIRLREEQAALTRATATT